MNSPYESSRVGPVLHYIPSWGESIGLFYDRFSKVNAVFDVFTSGMIGEVK